MSTQTCVSCGRTFERAYDGPSAPTTCPVCALTSSQNPQVQPAAAPQAMPVSAFPLTVAIVGLNFLIYLIMVVRGVSPLLPTPQDAIAYGADFGALTFGGQWWRLVTSMFVHFGIFHVGLNMWCLWNLGRAAERLMGKFSYFLAYMVSGIFGSIASVYWHPQAAGAGASGAIFGLAGVLVMFVYLKKTPSNLQINSRMLGSLGTFILYNLLFGAAIPGISNAAHIGGLVMGLAVGAMLPSASAPESSCRARLSLVILVSAVVLVASALYAKRMKSGSNELSSIRQLLNNGKIDDAMKKLQELTAREPELAAAQEMLGSVYMAKQKYPEAVASYERASADAPNEPRYQQELGSVYLELGKYGQALELFKKLVEAKPDDVVAHLGLGQSYLSLAQYDAAIPEFQKAVELKPTFPAPQLMLGQAQLRAGRYTDARATYTKLLEQNPDDALAQAGLNYAKQQRGSQ